MPGSLWWWEGQRDNSGNEGMQSPRMKQTRKILSKEERGNWSMGSHCYEPIISEFRVDWDSLIYSLKPLFSPSVQNHSAAMPSLLETFPNFIGVSFVCLFPFWHVVFAVLILMQSHSTKLSTTWVSSALYVVFSSVLAFNLSGLREKEEWGQTEVNWSSTVSQCNSTD